MIYDYQCLECGHEQEKMHKMGEKNQEPCDKCKAPAKKLKKIMSAHAKMGFSWSKWNI